MKFPETFPADDLNTLIHFFTHRADHTARDFAEAAFGVEGYALGLLIPATPTSVAIQPFHARACPATDAEALRVLEGLKAAHAEGKAGAEAWNWTQILAIVIAIIQQLAPLLGEGK